MTDTKIQNIIDTLSEAGASALNRDDEKFIIEALSDLARIKGAALPETLQEIEKRHQTFAELFRPTIGGVMEHAAHRDRATLLDALRAVTAERDELRQSAKDAATGEATALHDGLRIIQEHGQTLRDLDEAREALRAKEAELVDAWAHYAAGMKGAMETVAETSLQLEEQTELRAQLAQAQKEVAELTPPAELREENESLRRAYNTLAKAVDQSTPIIKEKLAQAERDKVAMREGLFHVRQLVQDIYSHYSSEQAARAPRGSQLGLYDEALKAIDMLLIKTPRDAEAEKGQESKAEWRAGLPPEALRRLHTNWEERDSAGRISRVHFYWDDTKTSMYKLADQPVDEAQPLPVSKNWAAFSFRPYCWTWEEAEVLAAHRDVKTGDMS